MKILATLLLAAALTGCASQPMTRVDQAALECNKAAALVRRDEATSKACIANLCKPDIAWFAQAGDHLVKMQEKCGNTYLEE